MTTDETKNGIAEVDGSIPSCSTTSSLWTRRVQRLFCFRGRSSVSVEIEVASGALAPGGGRLAAAR
jgi:hypothetical protein